MTDFIIMSDMVQITEPLRYNYLMVLGTYEYLKATRNLQTWIEILLLEEI